MDQHKQFVFDVDSHWTMPWEFRLRTGPLKKFTEIPEGEADLLTFFLSDDLYQSLPPSERPDAAHLFPTNRRRPNGDPTCVPELFEEQRMVSQAKDRVVWMDKIGIDYAIVNAPGFPAAFPFIKDIKRRQAYCYECNDLLAAELDGYQKRLGIVATVDLSDLDWAIKEATRMRGLGSRALTIRAEPVGGKSLGHPYFDRLWSAVVDLGMIVNVHTGLAPALFGDWGRLGLDTATSRGRGNYLRMANSQRHQAAEFFIYSMIFGDVFIRHPKLTVLIAELNIFWLPNLVNQIARATYPNPIYGDWEPSMGGRELLYKHVRVSPLPGLGDTNAMDILEALPEMVVFCSDYPHSEGNPDPIVLYGERLQSMNRDIYRKFMGDTMLESFTRTGDPIH